MYTFKKQNANINVSHGEAAMSEDAILATLQHSQLEQNLEAKRIANEIKLPTNDDEIKLNLRFFNHPICFFGEAPEDRRIRLRNILSKRLSNGESIKIVTFDSISNKKIPDQTADEKSGLASKKVFYTKGENSLRDVRLKIMKFSFESAKKRRLMEKNGQFFSEEAKRRKQSLFKKFPDFYGARSEIGDVRPLSAISISDCKNKLLTGAWSGNLKLWDLKNFTENDNKKSLKADKKSLKADKKSLKADKKLSKADKKSLKADKNSVKADKKLPTAEKIYRHSSRIADAKFLPSNLSADSGALRFISAGVDGLLKIWKTDQSKPIGVLRRHSGRLSRLAIVPCDIGLAVTTSFDKTWCLWDLNAEKCVLQQPAHSSEAYALAVHPDSSLCLTGDLTGICRIWDLRTGQVVLNLRSHVRQILSADFSPMGYQAATGSGDNTVKIWDLRKKSLFYTIPAHFKDVSTVKFQKGDGQYLITTSFDKTVRIWSSHTWRLQKTMVGHDDKVTCCDIDEDSNKIFTASFDRTWKMWSNK